MKILPYSLLAVIVSTSFTLAGPVVEEKNPVVMEEPAPESPWWFRVAPYTWIAAVDGDLTLNNIKAPINTSFADVFDTVDLAAMGVVEVGYDRFGIGVDVVYAKFSDDASLGGRLFKSARLEQKQWMVTPRASYRVIETDDYMMDVYAGARWTYIELDFTLRFSGGGQTTTGGSEGWWDPIVGVRGQANFTERVFMQYSGLIGGFGVSSDFLWDAYLGLGYKITPNIAAVVGYRGAGVDYSDDGFGVDTISHGPILGLDITF